MTAEPYSAALVTEMVADLAAALQARGARLACAESCTGGLLAAACTERAGSSHWFDRGVVSYSNSAKTELLSVPNAIIDQHGAVSEPVARAMAEGLQRGSGADITVAITGIAGPGGGTPDKPVGTVWFGYAWRGRSGMHTASERCYFDGDRARVRRAAVVQALRGLLQRLQDPVRTPDTPSAPGDNAAGLGCDAQSRPPSQHSGDPKQ